MEYTFKSNRITESEDKFLLKLQNYLELPLYIYGSIFRMDYFPNRSDIDIAIFTPNFDNTIARLTQFLGISLGKIKILKMKSTDKYTHKTKIIYGFKTNYILYIEPTESLNPFHTPKTSKRFEIVIYNKKNKNYINNINRTHFRMNFVLSILSFILKSFYYYFYLNETFYKKIKDYILSNTKTHIQTITILGTL